MTSITLTRQQLYDRAWTTPLDALAKELGLSGRDFGRLCDRHNISVTPRGWWAKKAAGHPIERTPLPAASPGTQIRFTFRGPGAENQAAESPPDTHPLVLYERQDDNRVDVLE